MGKNACFNRGTWSAEEDKILTDYVHNYGEGKWSNVCRRSGLKRSGKSCRLRWLNYLRPDIKRGNISEDEENLIIRLHNLLGNRWSLIAGRLPGRTDNEIKNYWNSYLKKKVVEEQKTVVDSKKQLQIPIEKIQSNEVIMNSQPQVEKIAESDEKACSTSSSSSSAIIKREDILNLLLDVDINDKWWERCYDSVDIFESSNRLNFPESTAETELHVLKNIERLEYGNPCDPSLLNHPFDLTNLSKFLELE